MRASEWIDGLLAGEVEETAAVAALGELLDRREVSFESIRADLDHAVEAERLDPGVATRLLGELTAVTRVRSTETGRSDATRIRGDIGETGTRVRAAAPETGAVPATQWRERGPTAADPPRIEPGTVLKGRFDIKALVGRGGMGSVYRAEDRRKIEARDPNPDVAIKVLNGDFQQHPDAFIALQREASKAQTLAHPNVVTVFDFDRDGRNVFITMELLQGQSLDAMIRATRGQGVGRATALPLIRGIAEGLAHAHRKGIVHSDLKPANVFVLQDGTPKILDFGIARAVPSMQAGRRDEFDAGRLGAYSEGYATEEMVDGADPAAADDVFALGIMAYELLTGHHPFGGKSGAAARALNRAPAPIRSLRRREWKTLARSLSFERAVRPRDAAVFLREFFGSTTLRNALIAATVMLALASAYLWYRNYQQSGPAVPFAELPAATQREVANDIAEGNRDWAFYTGQGIGDALTASLSHFAAAYELHKGNREAVRGLERAADEALKQAAADPQARREMAKTLADTSDYLKNYPPVTEALGR